MLLYNPSAERCSGLLIGAYSVFFGLHFCVFGISCEAWSLAGNMVPHAV